MRPAGVVAIILASVLLSGCGYHVVGHDNNLPKTIQSLAVPTFKNETGRFKIEQAVTAAVVRELLTRTRYQVRASESVGEADAVLHGNITAFSAYPVVFDPNNNRATTAQLNVRVRVSLVDRKTGKVLYENADFTYREHYEISGQPSAYFDESSAGIDRLSRKLAASLVSSILSGF